LQKPSELNEIVSTTPFQTIFAICFLNSISRPFSSFSLFSSTQAKKKGTNLKIQESQNLLLLLGKLDHFISISTFVVLL
jgi:hypothetical protein